MSSCSSYKDIIWATFWLWGITNYLLDKCRLYWKNHKASESGFETCSPSSDRNLYPKLWILLGTLSFSTNKGLVALVEYFTDLEELNFRDGIKALVHRWIQCITIQRDFTENKVLKVISYRKHIECCKSGKYYKHSKALMEGLQQGRATKLLSMSRQQLFVVIGLLTGHLSLYGHLHKIGKDINPLCRRCLSGNEIVEHLLCECESLTMSGDRIFGRSFGELQ